MKCSMDSQGTITIEPETPTETFALSQWVKQAIVVQMNRNWINGQFLIVQLPQGHYERSST